MNRLEVHQTRYAFRWLAIATGREPEPMWLWSDLTEDEQGELRIRVQLAVIEGQCWQTTTERAWAIVLGSYGIDCPHLPEWRDYHPRRPTDYECRSCRSYLVKTR